MNVRWLGSLVLAGATACGGRLAGDAQDAGADAMADAGRLDATADVDPRDPLTCSGGVTLPYDKGCRTTADCAIAFIYLGCCKTAAVGVAGRDEARLVDAGAECTRLDPCDCAGNAVVADDGHASIDPAHGDVGVACTDGRCTSRITVR